MDLPTITPITQRFIDRSELKGRVTVVSADVLRDQLQGSYDAAVLRGFIQVLSPEDAVRALTKIRGIVSPGGSIYLIGRVVDNTRLSPISAVGFSITTLNLYDDGQAYTEQEYPASGEATRTGRKLNDDGKLQRYSKKTGELIKNG